jgi:hypothetical protein
MTNPTDRSINPLFRDLLGVRDTLVYMEGVFVRFESKGVCAADKL